MQASFGAACYCSSLPLLYLLRLSAHCSPLTDCCSVQLKFFLPVGIVFERLLVSLVEQAILKHQNIDCGAHEAPVSIFRGADDRLTADVERGVHENAASRFR